MLSSKLKSILKPMRNGNTHITIKDWLILWDI